MEHTVEQGECVLSISEKYGFLWKTIWEHGDNAELRELRGDPNVLAPGDTLVIPEKRPRQEQGAAEQKHRFRRKGVPGKVKIRLLDDDEPRANERYELEVDGRTVDEGQTDGDGFIEAALPAGAVTGKLIVGEGDARDIYSLRFGNVDPIDTDEGVRCRLRDLGYDVDTDFEAAVSGFQKKQDLDETGQVDDATRQRLQEMFGQ